MGCEERMSGKKRECFFFQFETYILESGGVCERERVMEGGGWIWEEDVECSEQEDVRVRSEFGDQSGASWASERGNKSGE